VLFRVDSEAGPVDYLVAMNEKILIIIPTYNECENITPITTAVHQRMPEAHILFVDDNSPDGTGILADSLAEKDDRIQVIHRAGKMGLGTAYIEGFKYALERDYELIFEMDADFSHNPDYLHSFLDAARGGADLVLGSRYVSGGGTVNWGVGRKMISQGGSLYARSILGVDVRDLTGGFKCFRRRVLEAIDLDSVDSEGYSFQVEMTYRTLRRGFKVVEVPIIFMDRRVGQSKMSRDIFLEAIWMVWKLRLGS